MNKEGISEKKLSYAVSKKRKKKEAAAFFMVVTDLEYVQKQPSRGVFKKGVLIIRSKFTGEHPCQSVISKQLY